MARRTSSPPKEQRPDNSARIAALRSQIAGKQDRIRQLEEEIHKLRERIQRLDASKRKTEKRMRMWDKTMDVEKRRYTRVMNATVLRLGQGYGEKLGVMIGGRKGTSAYDSYGQIGMVYERQIEDAEEEIRKMEREIEQLRNDISGLSAQIASLA